MATLADFLDTEVRDKLRKGYTIFNADNYGTVNNPNMDHMPNDIRQLKKYGFEGNCIGWAYYCPALIRAGIRNLIPSYRASYKVMLEAYGLPRRKPCFYLEPTNIESLCSFFGITKEEFSIIIVPSYLGTEIGEHGLRKSINRLRKFANKSPTAKIVKINYKTY